MEKLIDTIKVQKAPSKRKEEQSNKADIESVAEGIATFALDVLHKLPNQKENTFLSPYSIAVALAMTFAGAAGDTEKQMANTLHFKIPQNQLHSAMNAIDHKLNGAGKQQFQLNVANSIWAEQDFKFLEEFLKILAEEYGSEIKLTDFKKDTEGSRKLVNKWVEDATNKKIPDLIPPGLLTADTRMILVNAIYFNADWQFPFEKSKTGPRDFNLLDGSKKQVEMMSLDKSKFLQYYKGSNFEAVLHPYKGGKIGMTFIVPNLGTFETFQKELNQKELNTIFDSMSSKNVFLEVPKFTLKTDIKLASVLKTLGMVDAFSAINANFEKMDGTKSLCIQEVIHSAFVRVDEKGTEAAAATAVVMRLGMAMMKPEEIIHLTIDRPFIFVIHDIETKTILFFGQITSPIAPK